MRWLFFIFLISQLAVADLDISPPSVNVQMQYDPKPKINTLQELNTEIKEAEDLATMGDVSADTESLRKRLNRNSKDLKAMLSKIAQVERLGQESGQQYLRALRQNQADRLMLAGARKDVCGPEINLNKKLPPIRNQTNLGWCYAFAAADLISYETGQVVSAADLATQYNLSDNKDSQRFHMYAKNYIKRSGYASKTLEIAIKKGYCLEKDFPSEVLDSSRKSADLFTALNEIETFQAAALKYPSIEQSYCENVFSRSAKKIFPNVKLEEFAKIFKELKTEKLIEYLGDINCKDKRKNLDSKLFVDSKDVQGKPLIWSHKIISDNLENNKPMVISINSSIFYGPFRGQPAVSDHVVIISGKRWNSKQNKCEYYIRNSWGPKDSSGWYDVGQILPVIDRVESLKSNR